MAEIATLLQIQPVAIPKPALLLYQNYRRFAPIILDGNSYSWVPFAVETEPTNDLQLSSSETMISIPRSSALEAVMRANNDLKKAVVIMYFIQPGTLIAPEGKKRQVSHATKEGANVLFTLNPVTDALRGNNITKMYERDPFREVPAYKARL